MFVLQKAHVLIQPFVDLNDVGVCEEAGVLLMVAPPGKDSPQGRSPHKAYYEENGNFEKIQKVLVSLLRKSPRKRLCKYKLCL